MRSGRVGGGGVGESRPYRNSGDRMACGKPEPGLPSLPPLPSSPSLIGIGLPDPFAVVNIDGEQFQTAVWSAREMLCNGLNSPHDALACTTRWCEERSLHSG
jgi:hypothetical protein